MDEGGGAVPRLYLVAEDNFDLARVLAARGQEGAEDAVNREGDLCGERADVVHCGLHERAVSANV